MVSNKEAVNMFSKLKKYCEENSKNACKSCVFFTGYEVGGEFEYGCGLIEGLAINRNFKTVLSRAEKKMTEEKPQEQTNEEYFVNLSTEEKAEFIATQCFWSWSAGFRGKLETKYASGEHWDSWLRKVHKEKHDVE